MAANKSIIMLKALPEDVVLGIWKEVFEESGLEWHEGTGQVLKDGAVDFSTEFVRKFVEAAIDHPHYANAKEIHSATGIKYGRVYDAMNLAKYEARKNRKVG